ncbi:LarC family nickel insertion protein, partial [bacterium]|nr:LarC family nickel insertion protein [bacterium]
MPSIAYFDCFSGISGDMIIGALLDAGLDFELFTTELEKLHLSGYEPESRKVVKQNIAATKFEVRTRASAPLRHLSDLNRIVDDSGLDAEIINKAKEIFLTIAKAEAKIHNQPLAEVHFHEIGAIDTIVDVVGSLIGLKLLGVERIFTSKINVGTGFVE